MRKLTPEEKIAAIKDLLQRARRTLVHSFVVPAGQENYVAMLIRDVEAIINEKADT